ncbi:hypothetical protein HD806DRAFT_490422 [Xylariaceae sp. AK1471]|nr:hypothetical protein HD806DRAFT_490422 [Xylariaceae sp. AK1471]
MAFSMHAPLWMEKVTCSSVLIRNSYVLAALRRATASSSEKKVAASIFNGARASRGRKHVKLMKMNPRVLTSSRMASPGIHDRGSPVPTYALCTET